jgi:hypothetical protein
VDAAATPTTDIESTGGSVQQVVYLLGAGATQGCISHAGGRQNLLMSGLADPISEELRHNISGAHPGVERLINDVVTSDSPGLAFEQLITFLEDCPTRVYRNFSNLVRDAFSSVLRGRLDQAVEELGPDCSRLYAALVDMHEVSGFGESLSGFLTLNYDVFLEQALVNHLKFGVDYGVASIAPSSSDRRTVKVLKMHGSFGWSEEWPIRAELNHSSEFWIPPGIRKPKNDYPFNAIWGSARELLACDVLRIIGCNLGPNDWDLVSLLFSTRHTHATAQPYRIEVISGHETARRIRESFPYLEVQWLPELPVVGEQIVSESLGLGPMPFSTLSEEQQQQVVRTLGTISNPFHYWLTQMGEAMTRDLASLFTTSGVFEEFVASGT